MPSIQELQDVVKKLGMEPVHLGLAAAAVITFVLVLVLLLRRRRTIRVSGIYYYPIKSCGGLRLSVAEYDRLGVQRDRRFVIIDEKNQFLNARLFDLSRMMLIQPSFEKVAGSSVDQLVLRAPGKDPLIIPNKYTKQENVTIWEANIPAGVYREPQIEAWLSDFLKVKCTLATTLSLNEHNRPIKAQYDNMPRQDGVQVAFNDAFPTLVISEASLADLQKHCSRQLCMEQFRPNLVVSGCGPYEEDTWRRIKIGNLEFNGTKACDRCLFTTVDMETGKKHPSGEPLTVLRKVRGKNPLTGNDQESKGWFGMNFIHRRFPGRVAVGDTVEIVERHPPTPVWRESSS